MEEKKILRASFTTKMITPLGAGGMCYVSGIIYTARDTAHLRLVEILKRDEEVPFDFERQVVYYTSPCPVKSGQPIGSVDPATRGRMGACSPTLVAYGLRVMIDKGSRSPEVVDVIKQYKGVYFAAIGGAAALMGRCVKETEVIAFGSLGPGAIRKLHVEELPVITTVDSPEEDVYSLGRSQCTRR